VPLLRDGFAVRCSRRQALLSVAMLDESGSSPLPRQFHTPVGLNHPYSPLGGDHQLMDPLFDSRG